MELLVLFGELSISKRVKLYVSFFESYICLHNVLFLVFLPTEVFNEQVAIKKMKKKYYSWDECINLREVKVVNCFC